MPFALKSSAFSQDQTIPRKYTLDGENLSPPLEWSDAPPGTKSFLLSVEDPDAPSGTFHHWGLFDIARDRTRLPEGVGQSAKTEDVGVCVNDFGHLHYDGPKPPKGHGTHHYHFRLAALDVESLTQAPKAKNDDIWKAAQGHILDETELVGTYQR